jgi:hypothetical protein
VAKSPVDDGSSPVVVPEGKEVANSRIDAAVAQVCANAHARVVILAHSCGSHIAEDWVHARGARALDQMQVPVLDIYAENDLLAVRRLAAARQEAILKGGNAASAQIVIEDSDHYFLDRGDILLGAVASWLDSLWQRESNGADLAR